MQLCKNDTLMFSCSYQYVFELKKTFSHQIQSSVGKNGLLLYAIRPQPINTFQNMIPGPSIIYKT